LRQAADASRSQTEVQRTELSRLLASSEFSTSRQLRDFLAFTAEQALAGRTHLDQVEIAAEVLGRGQDFNPQDDATVRKLATLTRQKLEQYYAHEGRTSSIRISLPLRSYVPRFTVVESEAAAPPAAPSRPLRLFAAVFVVGVVAGVLAARIPALFRAVEPPSIAIVTGRGDIMGKGDAPPGSVLLGPAIEAVDQVTVRLRFTPEYEAQQAGIVIWEDENNFVRLGRKFIGRVHIEFGHEAHGGFRLDTVNSVYDPSGQDGAPLWLTIRRDGAAFRAYSSTDGLHWRQIGVPIVHSQPMPKARAGVFGFNGRRQVPAATARFDHISAGPVFYDLPDDIEPSRWSLWSPDSSCDTPAGVFLHGHAFRFAPIVDDRPCEVTWTRPMPAGDWTLATRVDYFAESGGSAGLVLSGDRSAVRIHRSDVISFVHTGAIQVDEPDFPGRPPLSLRLSARNGVLTGSYSRDEQTWKTFADSVPVSALGPNLHYGVRVARRQGAIGDAIGDARFYWLRREIDRLVPAQ
jgi:hypothetical protein